MPVNALMLPFQNVSQVPGSRFDANQVLMYGLRTTSRVAGGRIGVKLGEDCAGAELYRAATSWALNKRPYARTSSMRPGQKSTGPALNLARPTTVSPEAFQAAPTGCVSTSVPFT